jgi:hypothetical protein
VLHYSLLQQILSRNDFYSGGHEIERSIGRPSGRTLRRCARYGVLAIHVKSVNPLYAPPVDPRGAVGKRYAVGEDLEACRSQIVTTASSGRGSVRHVGY